MSSDLPQDDPLATSSDLGLGHEAKSDNHKIPDDERDDFRRPPKLSDRQEWAIELTIQGYNDEFIAQKVGVNRKTLWRWKTLDDQYRHALNDARIHVHGGVGDRFRVLLNRAGNIFLKFMESEDEDKRFRAAYALVTMSGNFRPQLLEAKLPDEDDLPDIPPEMA
jgi:hypothetical protein